MKFTTKTPPQAFTPLILEITIESRDELMSLWHRFNIVGSSLTKEYLEDYVDVPGFVSVITGNGLWEAIENHRVKCKIGKDGRQL